MSYLDALNFNATQQYFFNGGGQIIPVKETSETGVYEATDDFPFGFFDSDNINNSIINILLPKTDSKRLNNSDSKVIYIKTYYTSYPKIPLINCNNQQLKYVKLSTVDNIYALNNIDVILPVYFANDSTYGYCLKIVGDPVINVRRNITAVMNSKSILYSSGFFEHVLSYPFSDESKNSIISITCPYTNIYSSTGINNFLASYTLTPTEINTQTYGDNNSVLKLVGTVQDGLCKHNFRVLNSDCTGYSIAFRGYAF